MRNKAYPDPWGFVCIGDPKQGGILGEIPFIPTGMVGVHPLEAVSQIAPMSVLGVLMPKGNEQIMLFDTKHNAQEAYRKMKEAGLNVGPGIGQFKGITATLF